MSPESLIWLLSACKDRFDASKVSYYVVADASKVSYYVVADDDVVDDDDDAAIERWMM